MIESFAGDMSTHPSDIAKPDDRNAAAFATSWNNLPAGSVYTREQVEDWFAPLTPIIPAIARPKSSPCNYRVADQPIELDRSPLHQSQFAGRVDDGA